MAKYLLSTKADKDQDDIADYTLETWGEKQAQEYIVGLVNCLDKIAETPNIGRDASEYSPNLNGSITKLIVFLHEYRHRNFNSAHPRSETGFLPPAIILYFFAFIPFFDCAIISSLFILVNPLFSDLMSFERIHSI